MMLDAMALAAAEVLHTQFCVIGSGPAGLAFALAAAARGKDCIILETGLDRFSPEHNADGDLDGAFAFGNLTERMVNEVRQVGGKSNAWSIESDLGTRGIRLLPYHAANFEARRAMGDVAWPFPKTALDPFYKEACAFFDIDDDGWDCDEESDAPLTSAELRPKRFRFSDGAVISRRIKDEVLPSPHIKLIYRATALRLGLDADGVHVDHIDCASAPGREFRVKARQFVLAGGALGTTSLMLRSDDVQRRGVGNQNDLVGRYFMDHPLIDGGQIFAKDRTLFDRAGAYDLKREGDGVTMTHLQLSDTLIRDAPVANMCAMLYPRPRPRDFSREHQRNRLQAQSAFRTLKERKTSIVEKARATLDLALRADHIVDHARRQKEEQDARINRGGWSTAPGAGARYQVFDVLHICEQAPRAENRVVLGQDRDRFGQRRVNIEWTWSDADKAAALNGQDIFVQAINRSGIAEYQVLSDDGEPRIVHSSLGHHIGTTRMHADPKQGVTDADGRVHGVSNLYIASSSLFPSGGWENPTLTVVALAQKLAAHLSLKN